MGGHVNLCGIGFRAIHQVKVYSRDYKAFMGKFFLNLNHSSYPRLLLSYTSWLSVDREEGMGFVIISTNIMVSFGG